MKHYGLPWLDLRKAGSQKKISKPISRQTFAWLIDSGNFSQTSIKQESTIAIGKTFFTKNNKFANLTG